MDGSSQALESQSVENEKTSRRISVIPLYNQGQSLQLCAVHTVNNLLQHTGDCTLSDSFILCSGKLHPINPFQPATKAEFDQIADNLTLREAALLNGDDTTQENKIFRKISYRQILQSHHRTPVTGNYSFEVLEAALSKRNVRLEWCNDAGAQLDDNNDSDNSVCIGFVINSVEPLSFTNALTSIFSTPRHWWAITKVRRVGHLDPNLVPENNSLQFLESVDGHQVEYNSEAWHLVDSSLKEVKVISNGDIRTLLSDTNIKNGSILRAILKI